MSDEEEPPCMSDEEEPPPTSPPSRPMKPLPGVREEERCGGGWSFPSPTYVREEERCGGDWSFPPRGMREEVWCGSREKQTSHSGLEPTSS
jgi:hypothetical protein